MYYEEHGVPSGPPLEAPNLPRALILAGCAHVYSNELRAWWRDQTPETVIVPERRSGMQASQ
jgi:hypothetical protein